MVDVGQFNLRFTADELLYMHVYVGHRPALFFIPPTCRLLLKDCYIDGVDWLRLDCSALRNTLFSIPITEVEDVNIGTMNTGYITKNGRRYTFGEGEKRRFGVELLRLGTKYAKPMNDVERGILLYHLYYYCHEHVDAFDDVVRGIIKKHEPSVENQALLSGLFYKCLQRIVRHWDNIKLNPLTERLLETLAATFAPRE